MDYERIATYLRSLEREDNELINDIESFAVEHTIPIAKRETVSFLQTIIELNHPKQILEVGTCIAYSTILMAMAGDGGVITTIEIGEADYNIACKNVKKAEDAGLIKKGQIKLIKGDATDILPTLKAESFDLVFMDAAKGQYINFLPQIMRLLSKGGLLVSDNVLQDGDIIESKYAVVRRDRTIHTRMRDYLYELKHMDGLTTAILPVGDGVTVSVKE